jgi:hypothetical protein
MRLKLIIQILYIVIIASSCKANKSDSDIIETKTELTAIEIINYFPKNYASIKSGYVKQTLIKMGFETYSKINDEFSSADTDNDNLYFDSLGFELVKKVLDFDYINQKHLTELIKNNFIEIDSTKTDLTLIGIITSNENTLLATLEAPTNHHQNWSIVKIWKYDTTINRLQIHSVLKANSNDFDFIGLKDHNLLLEDGIFIYRIVLDDEYRFEKNMDIFVSMETYDSAK